MDFDNAKENIQPLSSGRNATILQAALNSNSELNKMRESYESAIHQYTGEDPLDVWFEYILWIEQSYPSGGSESGLKKVLLECLERFESDERYFQDRRMIRIYIKYIDSESNPQALYEELYKAGVGTMVADLYICWAFYYDLLGNFAKTEKIFQLGFKAKAQPYDELDQAHKHFGFTMSQRLLYQDDASSKEDIFNSLRERRHALTSLRAHRKLVGSVRTGTAIKSHRPGKIDSDSKSMATSKNNNQNVNVYEDQNYAPNVLPTEEPQTVVRKIIDSARKQENLREPGPWNNHKVKQKGSILSNKIEPLNFEIMEDDTSDNKITFLPSTPNNYEKPINLPEKFAIKNFPQSKWLVKHVTETELPSNVIAKYPKFYCYPNAELEFSLEEYMGYLWFKKHKPDDIFVQNYSIFWGNDISSNVRLFPNFPKSNIPDKNHLELSEFNPMEYAAKMKADVNELYNNDDEKQMEEIFAEQWVRIKQQRGECTILISENIDETVCGINNEIAGSIFPSRKSMAPAAMLRKSVYFQKSDGLRFSSVKSSPDNLNSGENTCSAEESGSQVPQTFAKIQVESSGINMLPGTSHQNENLNQVDNTTNFDIFVDGNDDDPKLPTDLKSGLLVDVPKASDFKIPPPRKSLKPKSSFQIYQDDEECGESYLASNETFSTQIFNFNIKTQSVSTPISNKTSKTDFFRPEVLDSAELLVHPRQSFSVSSDTDSTEIVKPLEIGQKQLSVIMETSETNTNTKSSAETQITDDSSRTKSCPSLETLPKSLISEIIPEYRCLGAKPKDFSYRNLKDEKVKDSYESSLNGDLKSSIRIYEDKTETVPKMVLRKTKNVELASLNNKSLIFEDPKMKHNELSSGENQNNFNVKEKEKVPPIAGDMTALSSKLNDLTLPQLEISQNKSKIEKQDSYENMYEYFKTSPVSDLKIVQKCQNNKLLKPLSIEFDESLALPILNFKNVDLTLPNLENEALSATHMCNEMKLANIFESSSKMGLTKDNISLINNPVETNFKNTSIKISENQLALDFESFHVSHIKEKSLHIKTEIMDNEIQEKTMPRKRSILQRFSAVKFENSLKENSSDIISALNKENDKSKNKESNVEREKKIEDFYPDAEVNENDELSIYYVHTPKLRPVWPDDDHFNDKTCNFFSTTVNKSVDIDYSNPFSPDLIRTFLEQIDFLNYLERQTTCEITDSIKPLQKFPNITINNKKFNVVNIIGKGSYGTVYSAKDQTDKMYALKQEKPANLWEYYICLELCSRVTNLDIIKSFMEIECAIIAKNSSIFVTEFSKFGSLITVCNKIKRATTKNVNEYIVMILTDQILSIIDHLHSCHIIHADLKPDNILLTNQISFDTNIPVIQLVDFGVSIDMDLFPQKQTFNYKHIKDDFNCIEMKENRPWTYQIDLYGIAGIIHVLLFGKYMVLEKKSIWQPHQKIPRYFHKLLWEEIFSQLLNVRDCNSLPNLQDLRKLLKEELSENERFVKDRIKEFNFGLIK